MLEDAKDEVINTFLIEDKELYHFRPEYNTQRKIESYFKEHDDSLKIKDKLYYLLANVLSEEETEEGILYHPRFNLSKPSHTNILKKK